MHELFMRRALQLAELGRGNVSPNPMVGCVIVHDAKIIGEGWHQRYGEGHAEVNAVNAVTDKSLLPNSTVYVTLEPCSHFGKTPPCADLLIRHQVKQVVIANVDSNPLVGGKGIQKLREAGIEVITGVLEQEARKLNERFFCYIEKQRPFILLKWAESADGFIAKPDYSPVAISNAFSKKWVHQWRSHEDAIMVGTRTAQYDNPSLNVREWTGKNPIRVVIDKQLSLPPTLHLFDQTQPTLVYNLLKNEQNGLITYVQMPSEGEVIAWMLKDMYERKIQSILVEGGTQLFESFINAGLWDEIRRIQSADNLLAGIQAPHFHAPLSKRQNMMGDMLWIYRNTVS